MAAIRSGSGCMPTTVTPGRVAAVARPDVL
jgi:hypothetical protein